MAPPGHHSSRQAWESFLLALTLGEPWGRKEGLECVGDRTQAGVSGWFVPSGTTGVWAEGKEGQVPTAQYLPSAGHGISCPVLAECGRGWGWGLRLSEAWIQ